MNAPIVNITGSMYKNALRPLIFNFQSETVHDVFTKIGREIGDASFLNGLVRSVIRFEDKSLEQTIHGIHYSNPIGLAAGFDYRAQLTQVLPSIGFGFGTIGTITNLAYEGNPKPRLGRLPKSQSLMVNKGFKNDGVKKVIVQLKSKHFDIPIGMSIGRTNTPMFKNLTQAIDDICNAYRIAEHSKVKFSYYELNISCPNLYGNIDFYPIPNLNKLLTEVTKLKLTKPVYIKMPINKSDQEVRSMLSTIMKYPISGVIFGNLQKDRNAPSLDKEEVAQYPVGNFSGKPTEKRSNELIRLAYKTAGKQLTIIGCGGVFSAEDAYTKIKLGASLVQLITGLIFEGPQLPAQINYGLTKLLKKDGFTQISQAVGVAS